MSSDDNELTEVKALIALVDKENVSVGKESARNGEWIKISIKKVHTLLEMEDNDDIQSFLDYLCIDLNYVEEQRNNLMSKHRNLVQELNTCNEQLLVLKQAKIDLLTMQHVNTKILKENQNLRNELEELTSIIGAWLNRIDQLTEDTASSGTKDPVFVKSSADNSEVSITGSNKPKLSEAKDSTLSNHDTGEVSSNDLYHPLPPLEKLTGAEPVSGPNTIKLILKLKSTFKAETLKGITINESSSALARGNKSSSVSKTNLAPAGKLKNVKMKDDPPLAIVMKELNEIKLQISKNKSSYFRNKNSQQVPPNALQNKYKTQFKMNCELCGQNNHLSENCYDILFCKKYKRTNHRTCDHAEFMSSMNINQYHTGQGELSLRSRPARPAIPFPSCIHYGYNDHKSDDYVYYPLCEICGSYDHDTHSHNKIISLRRGINPRNLNMSQRNVKHVVAMFIPHLITMTLCGLRKEKFFKLRKLSLSKQNKQSKRGISINKERYINDLLRKYDKIGSSMKTPIMRANMLRLNLNSKAANESQYRGMIGSLMNLTASRPDIQFSTNLNA
ncbi:hypothetical protein Tco_0925847 [Tanacetum coccineum]|uniref:Uncharacterized protein n=1 Tax=Tanacetum coccineum TaxID=301880 RepID=A0ABQ5DAU3_9ASTR